MLSNESSYRNSRYNGIGVIISLKVNSLRRCSACSTFRQGHRGSMALPHEESTLRIRDSPAPLPQYLSTYDRRFSAPLNANVLKFEVYAGA